MFNTIFLVSYVVLWLLVLGMGFLLLGTLRSLGILTWQFDEMEAIRAALIEGEQSGPGKKSVDEIWQEARKRRKAKRG